MVRVSFWSVFNRNADGSITPKVPVTIGGISMGPGVSFGGGVSFSGVDLAALAGRDLEAEPNGAGYTITGNY